MSAVLKDAPRLSPMHEADLDGVLAIEKAIYSHPWTRGNFVDSLSAGYECRCLWLGAELLGYFVLMIAAQEAHLLNLSIAEGHQRRGLGSGLLRDAAECGRATAARRRCTPVSASARSARAAATTRRMQGAKTRWC